MPVLVRYVSTLAMEPNRQVEGAFKLRAPPADTTSYVMYSLGTPTTRRTHTDALPQHEYRQATSRTRIFCCGSHLPFSPQLFAPSAAIPFFSSFVITCPDTFPSPSPPQKPASVFCAAQNSCNAPNLARVLNPSGRFLASFPVRRPCFSSHLLAPD